MSLIQYSSDLATAEAPVPLPVGTYPATVTDAQVKVSQNSGNEYLSLTFKVSSDVYPPDYADGDPDGISLSFNRTVIDDTVVGRFRMRKLLEAFGLTLSNSVDPNDFIDRVANVQIAHEDFEGAPRANIAKVLAP